MLVTYDAITGACITADRAAGQDCGAQTLTVFMCCGGEIPHWCKELN